MEILLNNYFLPKPDPLQSFCPHGRSEHVSTYATQKDTKNHISCQCGKDENISYQRHPVLHTALWQSTENTRYIHANYCFVVVYNKNSLVNSNGFK